MLSGNPKRSEVMLCIFVDANVLSCRSATKSEGSWISSAWEEIIQLSTSEVESIQRRLTDGLQDLAVRLVQHPLPECQTRVIVADTWLASLGIPWSEDLFTSESATKYLLEQAAAAGYRVDLDDIVRLGDGSYEMPRMLCVFPLWLLAAFHDFSTSVSSKLTNVVPLSAVTWRFLPRRAGFRALLVETDGMVLSIWGQSEPAGVAVRRKPFAESVQCAKEFWNTQCLKQPALEQEAQPALMDLTRATHANTESINTSTGATVFDLFAADGPWPHRLDAVAGHSPHSPRFSSAIALGLVLFAAVTLSVLWRVGINQQDESERRVQSEQEVMSPSAPHSDRLRVAAVNAAIRELNLPVSNLLGALAPQPDSGVSVLEFATVSGRMGLNSQQPAVRVTAEARNGESMTNYISRVATTPPYVSAHIVQHETQNMSTERPLRFTALLEWSAAQ